MAIKLEMLRNFATVAQSGNLAEAAKRLGRTQSAVSMALKQLEDHLGARLFQSDRKNRLSPLGEQVFALARTQLRQFDATIEAIETSAASPAGLIRIASIPSVGARALPEAIHALTQTHPGLKFELRDGDSAQVIEALLHGAADIGIVSGRQQLNGIRQERLFSDRFGLLAAATHPLARQAGPLTIRDLARGDLLRNSLLDQISAPDFLEALSQARVSAPNTLSLLAMVRSGHWVTVLPRSVLELASGELIFRPIEGLEERREVCLLMRDSPAFPQFTEALWQVLIEGDWSEASER